MPVTSISIEEFDYLILITISGDNNHFIQFDFVIVLWITKRHCKCVLTIRPTCFPVAELWTGYIHMPGWPLPCEQEPEQQPSLSPELAPKLH